MLIKYFPRRSLFVVLTIAAITTLVFVAEFVGLSGSMAASEPFSEISESVPVMAVNTCESLPGGVIEVEGTGGTGTQPSGYPTLGAAFIAINTGAHTGVISIDVCGDTSEGTASAGLNASGAAAASYSSILITPVGGVSRTISGATTAGNPLINLNGADNVTLNGLNTSGNSLTISNTTASGTSGTSTIRFINDSTNNVVTNSTVLGSSVTTIGSGGGTILVSTAATGVSGNDGNVISNNNIGPSGSNLPTKAINGNGTSAAISNSGIVISGNKIFDYFGPGIQSAGVYVTSGNTDWSINNNRFYQTATRTQTAATIHAGIQLASSQINNCSISGNTIGFSNDSGSGTYNFVGFGPPSKFYPIFLSTHGTTAATNIQGNIITNIAVSGPISGTGTGASAPFAGILVVTGLANIGNIAGNTIGNSASSSAISVNSTVPLASDVYGIYYNATTSPIISNNTIGGITVTNSNVSPDVVDFYGIRAQTNTAATNTVLNNTVGFSAGPITNNSTNAGSQTYGIYSQTAGSVVTGNTISNLTSVAGSALTGSAATMIGLWVDNASSAADTTISQNTVRFLTNTEATFNNSIQGILYNGDTIGTHIVSRNLVHSISVPNSASGTVNGIYVQAGATSYQNNMIALGNGLTNGEAISGISEIAGTNNFFHNSVYIGGSSVAGGANTFAMTSAVASGTRAYRDNIFFNARSNGAGTGKHYAIQLGGTIPNPLGLTTNNNVLFASGTGGNTGRYNSADRLTLANWQTATGMDANSFSSDPQFISPAGTTPDLHISPSAPTVVEAGGVDVGVTDDFDGQMRNGLTPVDIGADAGNFTGVVVDTTPPETTINTTEPNPTNDPTGDFTFSANEPATFECSVDGAAFAACTSPFATAALADGAHTLAVRAIDTALNVDATPATYGWTVDTAPPQTTINSTPTDPSSDPTGDFTFSSSEAGTFECSVDGGAFTACASPFATAPLANGPHTFAVRAVDAAGNTDASPAAFAWTVNVVTPPFTVNNGGEGTDATPGDGVCETAAGNGICTLRAAIMEANALAGSDVINFGAGITTINTVTSLPAITTTMTIQGMGIVEVLGDTANQVFNVASGGNLTLVNLKVQDGGGTVGAGLQNLNGGTVLLTNCEFSFNTAAFSGGGIRNDGVMTINLSDIILNQAGIRGAGIFNGPLGSLTINDSNVNGNDNDPGTGGGGISNEGTLTVNRSLIDGNLTLGNGGGIENLNGTGIVTITNSTISFNSAFNANGGGIFNSLTGTINLNNSTVTNINFAVNGGGIFNDIGSTVNARSSIIAKNQATTAGPDVSGGYASPSFNLVGESDGSSGFVNGVNNNIVGTTAMPVDPLLGPLADNTGPTRTYAVLPNSPALDKGNAFGATTDQRGFARIYDNPSILNAADGTDIGSFERTAPTAADASLGGRITNADGRGIRNIRLVISGGRLTEPRTTLTGSFGYFNFEGLRVGETYIVSVSGKRYVFQNPTRVVSLVDEIADVDFVAEPR